MMSGEFDIEGDMQKMLQYSEAAVEMTETGRGIDTEFEYRYCRTSFRDLRASTRAGRSPVGCYDGPDGAGVRPQRLDAFVRTFVPDGGTCGREAHP